MKMEYLEKVIDDPEGQDYEWLEILSCFFDLLYPPLRQISSEEERILRKACDFHGSVKLAHCYDGPHSRPADDFIRQFASKSLEKRGL